MADFKIAYAVTAKLEGGYSNNIDDSGGETWKGIARNKNPNWSGWTLIDQLRKQKNFPANLKTNIQLQEMVVSFFKKQYWDALRLDECKFVNVANKLFDISVNMGQGFAGKILQKVLNLLNRKGLYYPDLKIDGQVGSATIAALNKHPNPDNIFKALNVLQGARYLEIGESNESQETFMNGWFENRIAAVLDKNDHSDMA